MTTAHKNIERTIAVIAQNARRASRTLAALSTGRKNRVLRKTAALLDEKRMFIRTENTKDILAGKKGGLSAAMLERLELSDKVIDSMISGVRETLALPDPVGGIADMEKRPNGLMVGRMRVPLGVIGMIYESRPNVTVDAAILCLKAGNAVILRGGSEAIHSNIALAQLLQKALASENIVADAVQVIPITDREAVGSMLRQEENIDLIIPRGGEGLIRFVAESSRIPVLKHYKGVCHIYVDKQADLEKALPVILNAKTQRPGVCNALEGLLIHKEIARGFFPVIAESLIGEGVELRGCSECVDIVPAVKAAKEEDWGTEFLDMILCVRIVAGFDEAKSHIERYGSQHTEVVLTENYTTAQRFMREIDASAVMVNASTRFNDGGELGLGTEIGISTTKLHAYGPMGLEELTTRKFVVFGEGQARP